MRFVEVAGFTTHYRLEGPDNAPVILFSNSLGTDFRIWDDVASALTDHYRVLRYDMRGHGLTDVTPGPYSMDLLARDCVDLLDALNIERAHVCGLSIGGMVAQQLAARHGERVSSVVFCDTAMKIGTTDMWQERADVARAQGPEAMVDAVMQRWFTAPFRDRGIAVYRNMFSRISGEGYAACSEAIRDADLRGQAADIRMPALALVGSEDAATPPDGVKALADAVKDARFQVIDNAGHIPCVEQPGAVTEALTAFLREVDRG